MSAIPDTFHGEFTSADASALNEANSRITLYGAGSTSALTLNASDYVIVTDINLSTLTAIVVQVYDGADATVDAGETIAKTLVAANSQPATIPLLSPHICQKGTWPKIKTNAAGTVNAIIHGTILRVS